MNCMRKYATTHFRPQPNLPGFPYYTKRDVDSVELEAVGSVTWEVVDQIIAEGEECGCSSLVCRKDKNVAVGLLTDADFL